MCWRVGYRCPAVVQLALELESKPANRSVSMAAKYFYRQGFLLLLFNFISTAALEKRFSDFKRCADEECSSKFCCLLVKSTSRTHLPITLIVQLAINCALSVDLLPIDIIRPRHLLAFWPDAVGLRVVLKSLQSKYYPEAVAQGAFSLRSS